MADTRSPIERMIDEATGYDPAKPKTEEESRDALRTHRLVDLANAAIEWHKAKGARRRMFREHRLHEATQKLIDLGW